MNNDDWRPTPPEIDHAPQVAVLAVLDNALDVAISAMVAAHPNLIDDEPFYRQLNRPEMKAANEVLARAHRLRDALRRYRRAVNALREITDQKSEPSDDPDTNSSF